MYEKEREPINSRTDQHLLSLSPKTLKMKPHEPKLPFRARPPYILQSMPKLILLAALILLALNFVPPFRHPLLQLYLSSSSSCNVSITPMVSSPSSIIRSSSSSPSSSSSSNVSITPSSMIRSSSSSPSSSSSSNVSITPMVSSPSSMSRSSSASPLSSSSSISLSNYSHLSSAQSFFLIQSDSTSSYSSSYPSPPPPSSPPPPPPAQSPPPSLITITKNSKIPTIPKDCDISKGEWIRDTEAPFYTNTTCWSIQEHQNCMKFGRPDTDFLKWRWRPQGCELPRFDPLRFLELVKGKSMAFVGDSLARNHMQSLLCLLSKVEYPKDISDTSTYKSMIYTKYNFTVSIFWSPFLVKSDELHQQGSYNLYLDEVDQKWASKMKLYDTIIISGGNWFNRPSVYHRKRRPIGCLYCNRNDIEQLTMQYSNKMAFRTALRAMVGKRYGFKGKVILRSLSPSHFEGGDWDKGGDCRRTKPYGSGETRMEEKVRQLYKAQIDELRRVEGEGRRRGVEFRVLDMTEAMLLRPDGHPSRYGHWPNAKVTLYNDCVHWCLPGPVDTWNDFLLHALS